MASEATKMAVIDNMHIHVRVFEVTEFNYEVRSDLRGYIIVSPLVFRAIALLFSGWFPSADQPCRLLAPTFAPTTPSISKVKEIGHEPDDDGNVQSTANGKPLSQTASLYPKFPLTQHDKFRLTRGCAPASLAQMILQINIGCRWSSSVFATNRV